MACEPDHTLLSIVPFISVSELTTYKLVKSNGSLLQRFLSLLLTTPSVFQSAPSVVVYLSRLEALKQQSTTSADITRAEQLTKTTLATELMLVLRTLGQTCPVALKAVLDLDGNVNFGKIESFTEGEILEACLEPIREYLEWEEGHREEAQGEEEKSGFERSVWSSTESSECFRLLNDFARETGTEFEAQFQTCEICLHTSSPPLPNLDLFMVSGLAEAITALKQWTKSQQDRLSSSLKSLIDQTKAANAQVKTLRTTNNILMKLLKSKEEMLDTVSDELYVNLLQSDQKSVDSSQQSFLGDVPSDLKSYEDLEVHGGNEDGSSLINQSPIYDANPEDFKLPYSESAYIRLESLAKVLRADIDRWKVSLSHGWKKWTQFRQILDLNLASAASSGFQISSLEGWYKAKLKNENPLRKVFKNRSSSDTTVPSPALFNLMYSLLDRYFVRMMEGEKIVSSFPEFVQKTMSERPSEIPLQKLLKSLRVYYSSESTYAYIFARLIQLFDQDPLLPVVTQVLVRLNVELKNEVMSRATASGTAKKIRDLETGGFLSLHSALRIVFSLHMATDPELLKHFLRALKPEELTDPEWGGFVAFYCAAELRIRLPGSNLESIIVILTSAFGCPALEPFLREMFRNSETELGLNEDVVAATGNLLEVARGDVLGFFLQVYDLYIDQLYVKMENLGQGEYVGKADFQVLLQSIDPDLTQVDLDSIWTSAHSINKTDKIHLRKDIVLLSIMTCPFPTVATHPLVSKVGLQPECHSFTLLTNLDSDDFDSAMYCTTLESIRGQRIWPRFSSKTSENPRRHRKTLSIFSKSYC